MSTEVPECPSAEVPVPECLGARMGGVAESAECAVTRDWPFCLRCEEAHGQRTTLARRDASPPSDRLQMRYMERQMSYFKFRLEPVLQLVAGLAAAFNIKLKRTGANLFLRWTMDNHHIIYLPINVNSLAPVALEAIG
jgi:hypothetical protein